MEYLPNSEKKVFDGEAVSVMGAKWSRRRRQELSCRPLRYVSGNVFSIGALCVADQGLCFCYDITRSASMGLSFAALRAG